MPKEITFYVFLGEKRVPSKTYANSNLCNLTHITQKPSYVYLLVGPTRYSSPVSRKLEILITPHTDLPSQF